MGKWALFGALGAGGFVLGWAFPEDLFLGTVSPAPFICGALFFFAALVAGRYFTDKSRNS